MMWIVWSDLRVEKCLTAVEYGYLLNSMHYDVAFAGIVPARLISYKSLFISESEAKLFASMAELVIMERWATLP